MDEMIHESEPHPSNEGYGYSKRMLEMQCRNYNEQYGREYICVIPVNLYGPYDNFNLDDSHVIPGLIHKFYNHKNNNIPFQMYGSGKALRQFMYSYDFCKIILKILFDYEGHHKNIICCNDEISIIDLTELICKISGCNIDEIERDISKPEGCMKKTVDSSILQSLYPDFIYTTLEEGITNTVRWFENNYVTCRK